MHKKYFYLICFLILGKIAFPQTSKENKESIIDYLNHITYPEFSGVILFVEKDSVLFERHTAIQVLNMKLKKLSIHFSI